MTYGPTSCRGGYRCLPRFLCRPTDGTNQERETVTAVLTIQPKDKDGNRGGNSPAPLGPRTKMFSCVSTQHAARRGADHAFIQAGEQCDS